MPKVTEVIEDEVLAQPVVDQQDEVVADQPAVETNDDKGAQEPPDVVITLGDPVDEPEEPAAETKSIKQMRDRIKELNKLNREREAQLRELEAKMRPAVPQIGPKPTLADVGYDPDAFEAAVLDWHSKKRQVDEYASVAQKQQQQAAESWNQAVQRYASAKAALPVEDYDDAEAVVDATMSDVQRGIIVSGASKPAELVYVLGKNPEKASELAKIQDPVKFAFAVAQLETQVKTTQRTKPAPETKVVGTASAGSADRRLEQLRAEAEKTGNYTKVRAYKQSMRSA